MTTDLEKPLERIHGSSGEKKSSSSFLRVLSLVILYPRAIAHDAAGVPHGFLVGMLIGMSILWVYGFGFVPRHPLIRRIFSPLVGWALLLGFGAAVFLH